MKRVMVAIAAIAVLGTAAFASERAITLTDLAVITDGEGAARILFKTGSMSITSHQVVRRATLRVLFSGQAEDRAFEVTMCPLTRDWSPGSVDWENSWTEPGGDFDKDLYARGQVDLSRGSGEVAFDVTNAVREFVEYDMTNYGFLITERHGERAGLRVEDAARFQSLLAAELTIETRTLLSTNRSRGRQ